MTTRHRFVEHVACRRCGGASGPQAAFCSSCGAYLHWWGEAVREEVVDEIADGVAGIPLETGPAFGSAGELPAPVHPHHLPSPHLSAMILRVAEQLHLQEHLHLRRVAAGATHHLEQLPESYAEFVAEPEPIEVEAFEPAPVLPAIEHHHLHDGSLAIDRPDEHGRLCPTCGTGNATSRAFCRHCGDELRPAAPSVVPHGSFWKRHRAARRDRAVRRLRLDDDPFDTAPHEHLARLRALHLPGRPKLPAAGKGKDAGKDASGAQPAAAAPPSSAAAVPPVLPSRHLPAARTHPPDFNALRAGLGKERVVSRLFPRLGMALMLGAAVGSLTIWRSDAGALLHGALVKLQLLADVEERTLATQSVSATASVPGRIPSHVTDGSLQTYWAITSDALDTSALTLTLASAQEISSFGVSAGIQNGDAVFNEQPRPHHVELTFDDGTTATISLKDTAAFQRHDIPDHTTQSITLRIVDTYPAVNGTGNWVALSELVPLQRRF